MSFFSLIPILIGIEANSSQLRIASIRKGRKGLEITQLSEFALEENVNPLYNFPKDGITVSALSSKETLVRSLDIKLKKEKDISSALAFQMEPLLPYSMERALIQAEVVEKKIAETRLTVLAVRKDHLKAHLEALQKNNIEPERVTSIPLALAALSTLFPQHEYPSIIVYKGEKVTTCALIENGKLLTARAFDPDQNFQAELQKTVLAFASSHKNKPFETVIYLGNDPTDISIIESTTNKLPLSTSSLSIPFPKEQLDRFAIAIGIALTQLPEKKRKINFRQKEFCYPKPFKRLGKPLMFFYLGTTVFFFSLFGWCHTNLSHQKTIAQNQFLSLIESEGRKGEENSIPQSILEYEERLNQIEHGINIRPDTFPLLPKIPKAREVLAWLSNHPDLFGKDGPLISIDSFNYTMVNAPDFTRRNDRYSVKVELELSASSPIVARKFHDALLSDTTFVDSKKEIEWTSSKGKYQASFFLKDNTYYH